MGKKRRERFLRILFFPSSTAILTWIRAAGLIRMVSMP